MAQAAGSMVAHGDLVGLDLLAAGAPGDVDDLLGQPGDGEILDVLDVGDPAGRGRYPRPCPGR
jgi:hypothetical protein